ncbi:MAG: hypothetical protein ACFE9L_03835 [Candidatus Hodarchaeota archaeon]
MDKKTIYLTHFDSYLHQNSLLQVTGHIHYGIEYRNYINLGFLYRDPAHKAPPLIGCYWEIEISSDYHVKTTWYNLGKQMKEYYCKNHPFAKFYLVKYWKKCPLCFNEKSNKNKIFKELL